MAWDDHLEPSSPTHSIASSNATRIRVIAGPGTGKSFAIKRRIARLLESGVLPNQILAVTFTRVAAEDLHRELMSLNVSGCEKLEGRTLHGLALSILQKNCVLTSIGRIPRTLNKFEEEALICDLATAYGGKKAVRRLIKGYLAAWAKTQDHPIGSIPGFLEESFSKELVEWLQFHRSMLVGEVIPHLFLYLYNNPAASERTEFAHLLCDEYQDLNQLEQSTFQLMSDAGNIIIVGDDDQSVYSFKHAHPECIREWVNRNPSADDLTLAECHRCPVKVVNMANALISKNSLRTPRQLIPIASKGIGDVEIRQFQKLEEETFWIAEKIASLIQDGQQPENIIVLAQRREIANQIKENLNLKHIPCVSYYDESPLENMEVQERFALFKLYLDNEDRPALRFLLGVPDKKMRASQYASIRKYCEENVISPWTLLIQLEEGSICLPYTSQLVAKFVAIRAKLLLLDTYSSDLKMLINHLFPETSSNLKELREIALASLIDGITPIELYSKMHNMITQPEVPLTIDKVRLMSLHKSKGLSSPSVFIAGCVQGLLPKLPDDDLTPDQKAKDLEEQRRLLYVAITRVKADLNRGLPGNLFLTYSIKIPAALAHKAGIKPARIYGKQAFCTASSFISELGPSAPTPLVGKTQ